MNDRPTVPSRNDIIQLVTERIYGSNILNNAHRGDVVEMMILEALGPDWDHKALGWHPWDFQKGEGDSRIRIQAKQTAALQLWGPTKKMTLSFGWSDAAPDYFKNDNPDEEIESRGYFCEIFIIGIHQLLTADADQADPQQWRFLIIPVDEIPERRKTMILSVALKRWPLHRWEEIAPRIKAISAAILRQRSALG